MTSTFWLPPVGFHLSEVVLNYKPALKPYVEIITLNELSEFQEWMVVLVGG
jgi:hypothetical protein